MGVTHYTIHPWGFFFKDSDGVIWEMNYVVTHTEAEGPEYTEIRKVGEVRFGGVVKLDEERDEFVRIANDDFEALPEVVKEAFHEHFFGKVIKHDG